jgi:hypothetical protein
MPEAQRALRVRAAAHTERKCKGRSEREQQRTQGTGQKTPKTLKTPKTQKNYKTLKTPKTQKNYKTLKTPKTQKNYKTLKTPKTPKTPKTR